MPELKTKCEDENSTDSLKYLKSLEGFVLALSPDGDFVYVSENVSDYLGISQVRFLPFYLFIKMINEKKTCLIVEKIQNLWKIVCHYNHEKSETLKV